MAQSLALAKRPHVIVATPGRIIYHLENTKGFNLKSLKYLVLDEADKLLNMDFEEEITKMLTLIPKVCDFLMCEKWCCQYDVSTEGF